MAQSRWWSVSWKRVGLTLLIIAALPALLALWISLIHPAVEYQRERYDDWHLLVDEPRNSLLPKPLPNTRTADISGGLVISRSGYSFQVPWIKAKKIHDYRSGTTVYFDDGTGLSIPGPTEYHDLLNMFPTRDSTQKNCPRLLLGERDTRSHYDLLTAELNTLPKEIGSFMSSYVNWSERRRRAVWRLTNKMIAMIEVPAGVDTIYVLTTPLVKGFQFGDPQKAPYDFELLLFDRQDRPLRLEFRGPMNGARPILTQEQTNAVVASIRPVDVH